MHPASLIVVAIYLFLCLMVGVMAGNMHRSLFGWALLAFLFSPVTAIIFLIVAGPPVEPAAQVRNEEDRRHAEAELDQEESRLAQIEKDADITCPKCRSLIDPATRAGLKVVEDEPWRLICSSCDHEIDAEEIAV